jgi:enoyl-CoA hydratase/carnithine racemase
MSARKVLRDDQDGVTLLTINRPERLNALDYETIDLLMAELDAVERNSAIGVVILTGAGDRAFSAGADIVNFSQSIAAGKEVALREFVERGQRFTSRIEGFSKPVIVAVNGLAYGGGCEITEAAPLAIASDQARFAKPEINLGFLPTFGGTQRLARLVGRKRALAMMLTTEPISAHGALEIGLVNRVVTHDRLLAEAMDLAATINEKPRLAVSACLAAVTRGLNVPIDEGLAIEAAQFAALAETEDVREGVGAFIEKRDAILRAA